MFYDQADNSSYRTFSKNNLATIAAYDKSLSDWLDRVHDLSYGDELVHLKSLRDKLKHIKEESTSSYLDALLYPEKSINCKIPSNVPFPTSSFKMHNTATIATNALGNFSFVWNPFYITDVSGSIFFVNNAATLDGASSNNNYVMTLNGFGPLPPIYSEYRLVSASVIVTCKSSQLNLSGNFSGGILLDPSIQGPAACAPYGNFLLTDDLYFNQVNLAKDGIRLLYFPCDPSYEQFYTFATAKYGFMFNVYGQSLQPSTACVRIDFYANFEAVAKADYLQYIPRSVGQVCSTDDKNKAIRDVQKNVTSSFDPSILNNVKKEFDSSGNTVIEGVEKFIDTIDRVGSVMERGQVAKSKLNDIVQKIFNQTNQQGSMSFSEKLDNAYDKTSNVANLAANTLGMIFGPGK